MRALRMLLILFAVFSLLFVAADRITVQLAQNEAADRIRAAQGLAGDTEVLIKGFPFLTQVALGRLDQVELRMSGFETAADPAHDLVTIARLHAQLYDVTLDGGYRVAEAGHATGTALIGYDALNEGSDSGSAVVYGGQGMVRMISDGHSVLSRVDVTGAGSTIALRARPDFRRTVGGLLDGMRLDSVTPTADGLSVAVSGKDIRVAG